MQIKEYIQKNLSSLNFNVLSSIYEENGLELTEEIKSYLKETPKNTNLAILEQLSRSGSEENIYIYYWLHTGENYTLEGSEPANADTTFEGIKNYIQNEHIVKFYLDDTDDSKAGIYVYDTININITSNIIFKKEDNSSIKLTFYDDGSLYEL